VVYQSTLVFRRHTGEPDDLSAHGGHFEFARIVSVAQKSRKATGGLRFEELVMCYLTIFEF
jgi:hypothetical protein